MSVKRWTPEEKALLKSDISNDEIAKITGKHKRTVETMRYKYTGHYCTKETQRDNQDEKRNKIRGDVRIIEACKRLGVRLLDCRG